LTQFRTQNRFTLLLDLPCPPDSGGISHLLWRNCPADGKADRKSHRLLKFDENATMEFYMRERRN
jgi:hypothetical protein